MLRVSPSRGKASVRHSGYRQRRWGREHLGFGLWSRLAATAGRRAPAGRRAGHGWTGARANVDGRGRPSELKQNALEHSERTIVWKRGRSPASSPGAGSPAGQAACLLAELVRPQFELI